ncbi:hypothetical protein Ssi02_51260 [Sinosporangium siamense]|uniref:Uncharacterized protein n=1 Tax=Sinosporangium siamense TaxID=1367973 RepID=A0A919RL84_9ACTN|nr:hypothetical protein Ssi02_51260 [Sinosporangium siamense]
MLATPSWENVPITDHLQGWGTVFAVVVALAVAVIGWRRESTYRADDQRNTAKQQAEDRADAERRLRDERDIAEKRLQNSFGQYKKETDGAQAS